jgi:WXG100 family type VII secretion target
MSQESANKLEAWFAGLPGIVQSALHEPFTWMNESLKSVSGDPQALLAAAPHYLSLASSVTAIADDQLRDRDNLARAWSGDAFEAFSATVDLIDNQLRQLTDALGNVPQLLDSAAQACVESANMIIDLVTSLIMFAISLLVTNLALAILTAGVSAAASVAVVLARAAQTAAQIASVVTKLSQILTKVAEILRKLAAILQRIVALLKRLQQVLTDMKKAAKTAQGMDKARKKAEFLGRNALVTNAVAVGTLGVVDPPTTGRAAKSAGKDYLRGLNDANDAIDSVR